MVLITASILKELIEKVLSLWNKGYNQNVEILHTKVSQK